MRTAVIGASGYTGGELLRLLGGHSTFVPEVIIAHTNAGELISSLHPHLVGYGDQVFAPLNIQEVATCELVFLAMPHGQSAKLVPELSKEQIIVDLGADFRLESADAWNKYYEGSHAGTWTYGLPELPGARKKIAQSTRVANPGCYATAIALSCAPILGSIDAGDIVVVAASGTTGAGRGAKVSLLGSEVMNSLSSYKFGGVHQHIPEIEESLQRVSNSGVKINFTPILAPMPRGILSTVSARIKGDISEGDLRNLFTSAYDNEEFVHFLPQGQMPKTASVLGSNKVQIQVALDSHTNRVVVSCAIDNLGKGAAGQAIQNANIICALDENDGLASSGLGA